MNNDQKDAMEVALAILIAILVVGASTVIICACVQHDNSPDKTCRAADNFRKIPCDFYSDIP